jgi:hypothetical protein
MNYNGLKNYINNFGMEVILVELCGIIKRRNTNDEEYLNQLYEDIFTALSNYRNRYLDELTREAQDMGFYED